MVGLEGKFILWNRDIIGSGSEEGKLEFYYGFFFFYCIVVMN